MIRIVKSTALSLSLAVICYSLIAQQKQLTGEQYFKNNFKEIIQPLPVATLWIDDTHFLLLKEGKTFVVNAKNGTEKEATVAEKNIKPVTVKVVPYL